MEKIINPFIDGNYAAMTAADFAAWLASLSEDDLRNMVVSFALRDQPVSTDAEQYELEEIWYNAPNGMYLTVADQRFDKNGQYVILADHITIGGGYTQHVLCRLNTNDLEQREDIFFRALQDICGKHRALESEDMFIIAKQ